MIAEGQFGTGGIEKKLDLRDFSFGGSGLPFDWAGGYDIEKVVGAVIDQPSFITPTKDQDGSLSCGGQAGSYLEAVLNCLEDGTYEERSAKSIYSHIFYPEGGTTLRDVLNLIVSKGVSYESAVPSYDQGNPPGEAFMRDTSGDLAGSASASASRGLSYAFVPVNIESVAEAIRDSHGAIILLKGQDNGTWRLPFPKPPVSGVWAHFVFAGKAKLINGRKYIGVHNSWGDVGEKGWQWIGEDYFNSGFILDCGVIVQNAAYLNKKTALTKTLLALLQKLLAYFMGPSKKPIL